MGGVQVKNFDNGVYRSKIPHLCRKIRKWGAQVEKPVLGRKIRLWDVLVEKYPIYAKNSNKVSRSKISRLGQKNSDEVFRSKLSSIFVENSEMGCLGHK